jgi:hypothetical protein
VRTAAATLAAALLCGTFAGCSSGRSSKSVPAGHAQRDAPLRDVIVRREVREGIVIRDRATRGKRFFLTGIQAGECLSYLKANPNASVSDVRAACPGEAVVAMVSKQTAAQAR